MYELNGEVIPACPRLLAQTMSVRVDPNEYCVNSKTEVGAIQLRLEIV